MLGSAGMAFCRLRLLAETAASYAGAGPGNCVAKCGARYCGAAAGTGLSHISRILRTSSDVVLADCLTSASSDWTKCKAAKTSDPRLSIFLSKEGENQRQILPEVVAAKELRQDDPLVRGQVGPKDTNSGLRPGASSRGKG